jgi:hypothetical protein
MILTKYRILLGDMAYTETLSLEEAENSGYEYIIVEEEITIE